MKTLSALLLVVALSATTIVSSPAATDKLLQNVRGDVTYQPASGAPQPLAPNASVALSDNDYAITGGNLSQAAISLPDSTRILVGQNTKVQLAFFNQQADLTTAKVILFNGKTRFLVQHPGGAKANYTFQTSTGQIAVRGTEGDISLSDSSLQVNVYDVSDPAVPVEVTLTNGTVYQLGAGQSLTVNIAPGGASTSGSTAAGATTAGAATTGGTTIAGTPVVAPISDVAMEPFVEFGLPESAKHTNVPAPATGAPSLVVAAALAAAVIAACSIRGGSSTAPPPTPKPTAAPKSGDRDGHQPKGAPVPNTAPHAAPGFSTPPPMTPEGPPQQGLPPAP